MNPINLSLSILYNLISTEHAKVYLTVKHCTVNMNPLIIKGSRLVIQPYINRACQSVSYCGSLCSQYESLIKGSRLVHTSQVEEHYILHYHQFALCKHLQLYAMLYKYSVNQSSIISICKGSAQKLDDNYGQLL